MKIKVEVFRSGEYISVPVPFEEGMRVLDAVFFIQRNVVDDLAFRWNCGEGICGSCAMELDGKPMLACKTEITSDMKKIRIDPLKAFPVIKDLVVDRKEVDERLKRLKPYYVGQKSKRFLVMGERETMIAAEMRKCIDCLLCHDVCHVLREHKKDFIGPRGMVKVAAQEYHPRNKFNRFKLLKDEGVNFCNVTRCCSEVCPQDIKITQNAIIPAKEYLIKK